MCPPPTSSIQAESGRWLRAKRRDPRWGGLRCRARARQRGLATTCTVQRGHTESRVWIGVLSINLVGCVAAPAIPPLRLFVNRFGVGGQMAGLQGKRHLKRTPSPPSSRESARCDQPLICHHLGQAGLRPGSASGWPPCRLVTSRPPGCSDPATGIAGRL